MGWRGKRQRSYRGRKTVFLQKLSFVYRWIILSILGCHLCRNLQKQKIVYNHCLFRLRKWRIKDVCSPVWPSLSVMSLKLSNQWLVTKVSWEENFNWKTPTWKCKLKLKYKIQFEMRRAKGWKKREKFRASTTTYYN